MATLPITESSTVEVTLHSIGAASEDDVEELESRIAALESGGGDGGSMMPSVAVMASGGIVPDVDVIIIRCQSVVVVNPSINRARTAQVFTNRGPSPVTIQGTQGQTIEGAAFTLGVGTPTAPITAKLVRDPASDVGQWLRV